MQEFTYSVTITEELAQWQAIRKVCNCAHKCYMQATISSITG